MSTTHLGISPVEGVTDFRVDDDGRMTITGAAIRGHDGPLPSADIIVGPENTPTMLALFDEGGDIEIEAADDDHARCWVVMGIQLPLPLAA